MNVFVESWIQGIISDVVIEGNTRRQSDFLANEENNYSQEYSESSSYFHKNNQADWNFNDNQWTDSDKVS